jgi:ATP-dependent DNA helicase DinG
LPRIIEPPNLIRCEYAKKKGWPDTFRQGSVICVECRRFSCEFHPHRGSCTVTRTIEPKIPRETKHQPRFLTKPQALLTDFKKLTADVVLAQFPSPTLRRYQEDIVKMAVEAFRSGKRCLILAAPTGFGKSYVNAAFASIARSFYATPQLALVEQIMADPYLEGRFVEVMGKRNYRCHYKPNQPVHVGKCVTEDYSCPERFDVCPYWKQKMTALNASAVLTSLAYLVAEGLTEGSETYLGKRTLLILDEAHNLEEQCLNHISLKISPFTIPAETYNKILPELLQVHTEDHVRSLLERIEVYLRDLLGKSEKIAESTGLTVIEAEELDRIRRYETSYENYKNSTSEWVWQVKNDELTLQPIFGRDFIRDLVWKRAEYFIISSATILDYKEYAQLTGLSDFIGEDQIEYLTVPSTFPPENRPIIDATVGPLSAQYLQENMPKAIRMVEDILRNEPGNVAIHCHGYNHQRSLVEGISDEFKPRLIVHTGRDREEKLREWMRSRGKVFVSVAFNEGQDWKYTICDAQILLKVPFPDIGDPRVKRRLEIGLRGWYEKQAMLEVIQAYGRAMRAEDDKARFYVVDGSFNRLLHNCSSVIPDWFKDALPSSPQITQGLEKSGAKL